MKYSNRKISGVWYIKLTIKIHYHILVDDKAKILPCNKTLSLFRIIRGVIFISPSFTRMVQAG